MPSATVHARFAALAVRLIAKHGRALSLVTTTATGDIYNPTNSETTTAIVGVETRFDSHEINGDLVRHDDKLFLIDSVVTIEVDMRINDGLYVGQSIVSVVQIKPGMTSVIYKVQLRGGGVNPVTVNPFAVTMDSTTAFTMDNTVLTMDMTEIT